MSTRFRIFVVGGQSRAAALAQELSDKGYEMVDGGPMPARQAMLDGSDLGGHCDYLQDMDGEEFVIVGRKNI